VKATAKRMAGVANLMTVRVAIYSIGPRWTGVMMDRPRVVVGFCRDWIEYADWLEAERDKLKDNESIVKAHWDVLPLDFKLVYELSGGDDESGG
jgi:hypothetical protein